jgi:hypothetical protein
MRTLSPALLAAQRGASAVPYVEAAVSSRIGGVRRLDFERLYAGGEPDGCHAAAMPGDGSLVRSRVNAGRLYYQRVGAPGGGSNFSSWTDLGAAGGADAALCAEGARLLLFYVDPDGVTLRLRESTDNGATLGAAVSVATASSAVAWLAADVKTGGDALLLYSAGAQVYSVLRSGGSWGTPAAWTNAVASVTGLACYHHGDWNAAVCGTGGDGAAFVWTAVLGDGFSQPAGVWSGLREVTRSSGGSGLSFRAPFLSRPDTFRLTFVERFSGAAPYSRPYHAYTPGTAGFAANLWREPFPFDLGSEFGQALAFSGDAAWLTTPSGVWRAPLAVPETGLTPDLLEAATDDGPFAGRLRLTLRNDKGQYSPLPAALRTGAEIRISPGYVTAEGPQASDGPAYWIERIEHRTGGGESVLVVEARDAWSLLEAWRPRRQYQWAAGQRNIFGILQFLFARAGLELTASGAGAAVNDLYPAFTVHPGDSGLAAVRRLLARAPDVIMMRGEFGVLRQPLQTEDAVYGYGDNHSLYSGRYSLEAAPANRVQVFGAGVFAERFDWADAAARYDRLLQADDRGLTAVAQAEGRAEALLRHAALRSQDGEVTVPPNCGQELYDVIEVTDRAAGLTAARRRVLGLALRYSARKGVYEQRIALGAV